MKKVRLILAIILVVALIGTIFASVSVIFGRQNKNNDVLEPVNKLISTLYYNQGSYNEYKSLFIQPNKALKEDSFNNVRKYTKVGDYFKYDSDNIKSLMKHMVVVKNNDQAVVYYVKDTNSQEELKTAKSWALQYVDGKWKIKD